MNAYILPEPELEFGGGRHIDIRFGLTAFGPLDRAGGLSPRAVRVGVVGDPESVDLFCTWVNRCRGGVERKESRLSNLYPAFPGFGDAGALCDFVCGSQLSRVIKKSELEELSSIEPRSLMMERSVERYIFEIENLIEHAAVDVVVCLLSPVLLKRIDMGDSESKGPRSRRKRPDAPEEQIVWHDLLKARAMRLRRPVQVIRPATYGGKVRRYKKDGTISSEAQDEATRAWNFFCAIYYKAGGVPWRLVREPTDLSTCYVGVSFFKSPEHERLQTSVAQVFNERGEGVIVRGGQAVISKTDRVPHLSQDDSANLLKKALALYRSEHRTIPARLVCHKSSEFDSAEMAGFREASKEERIDSVDLISLRRSFTRAYRLGSYPPLRGTVVELSDRQALLYTQGSVSFYQCYPGLYVPRPLDARFDAVDQSPRLLLSELLSLSKMNWNSTQFINLEPITLAAARNVGDIFRYLGETEPVQARYSYYM